jgi:hypothetical protein
MKKYDNLRLAELLNQRDIKTVLSHVRKIFLYHYSKKDFKGIKLSFNKVEALFEGKYKGYNACNTNYHNFNHTMDVLLASARLLDGYNSKIKVLPVQIAINLLNSSLFHDVGYIQEEWDNQGTGAKHIEGHIGRSIAFIVKNRTALSLTKEDVDMISKMIRCTDQKYSLSNIPFLSEDERTAGMMLGTANILGQMSDREYLEKLIFLYHEIKEAGMPGYKTEYDIILHIYKHYANIKKRINNTYKKVYIFAEEYFYNRYNINENLYIKAIENNISYIEKIMKETGTNFRHKLKRGNIITDKDLYIQQELASA